LLLSDQPFCAWEDGPALPDISHGRIMADCWAYLSSADYRAMRVCDGKVLDPVTERWRVLLLPKVSVLAAWPTEPPAPRRKRDVPRIDYGKADAPLVAEMRAMVAHGKAKDRTDAARALAHRAAGSAKDENKVRRLVSRGSDRKSKPHK